MVRQKCWGAYSECLSEEPELLIKEDEPLMEVMIAAQYQHFVGVVLWLVARLPSSLQQLKGMLTASRSSISRPGAHIVGYALACQSDLHRGSKNASAGGCD